MKKTISLVALLMAAMMLFNGYGTATKAVAEETAVVEESTEEEIVEAEEESSEEEEEEESSEEEEEEEEEEESSEEEEESSEEEEEPTLVLKDFADEDVVATVDGVDVTYGEIKPVYDYYISYYGYYFDTTDPEVIALFRTEALYYYMQTAALTQKGEEMGLYPFDEETTQQLKDDAIAEYWEMVDYYKDYFMTDDTTDEEAQQETIDYLAENGYTEEIAAEDAVINALYEKMYEEITKDVTMTDEEAYAKYDEYVEEAKATYTEDPTAFDDDFMSGLDVYYIPAGYRSVKQILVMTDEDSDETEVQAKLDEIMARIEAGEDFDTLIDEYNEDPGMQEGSSYAETGYYVAETTTAFDDAFKTAAMALENVGDVSEPTEGSYGYYIIRYDHDLPEGKVELSADKLEEFKESCLEEEKSNVYSDTVTEWIDALEVVKVEGFDE